jgi:PAS domain S-box-containing protein
MAAGATDYLIKSELSSDKLERSIRYAVERSVTLKSLRQNEKKFRSIFEKSKDAVFIADENFFFKEFNESLLKLLGYETMEILRLSVYDLIRDPAKSEAIAKQLSADREISDIEIELTDKKGESLLCLLSASALTDDKGNAYIQGIIHDMTGLKKTERAYWQSEKLKATNRLLKVLAHEVRNPLTNINIAIDMIEHEEATEAALKYLEIVRRSSNRINELISELLDTSRQNELTFQKISLQEIFTETIARASDRVALQSIEIVSSYPKEEAFVYADPDKIKIALLNIIINAIEAISHVEGRVSIKVEKAKKTYEVYIEDNGVGIPEENLVRLFEPYFTSKRNGLGLGLASAFAILQSHSIGVDVKTKAGKGTSFMLSFPKHEIADV